MSVSTAIKYAPLLTWDDLSKVFEHSQKQIAEHMKEREDMVHKDCYCSVDDVMC